MAVSIPIVSEFDTKGIKSAINEFKSLEGAGAKAQFALKKAAVPAAAALAALGAAATVATKAAVEDLKAQELLAQALRNTTNATDAQIAANEQFVAATERAAAVSDDQLRPALANLVRATGDVTEAQNLLTVALDISAATGSDLESVSIALSKAANGQVTALQRLGIPLDANAVKAKDFDAILRQLSDTFGGAAATSANSYEGQMRRISIAIDNTKENIGMALIPVIERLLPILDRAAQFVQNNTDVIVKLGAVVGVAAGAILAINAGMKVYQATLVIATAAQTAFNFVMAANPIGLVITAVAALVAGFAVLVAKTGGVKNAFMTMGNFIINVFENIVNTFNSMINAIIGAINRLPGVEIPFVPKLDLPEFNIPGGGSTPSAASTPTMTGTTGPDLLERAFLRPVIPTIPAKAVKVPSVGGGGGGRAGGGGRGEAVFSPALGGLEGLGQMGTLDFSAVAGTGIFELERMAAMARGENLPPINITINAAVAEASLGDTIVDALTDYNRRSGPLQLQIAP